MCNSQLAHSSIYSHETRYTFSVAEAVGTLVLAYVSSKVYSWLRRDLLPNGNLSSIFDVHRAVMRTKVSDMDKARGAIPYFKPESVVVF